ncbi:unnamed protein product [Pipistrellus nathusii]|uniref:Uncharacterized protein n=1 Tax=Pipistrellus nathusii TaxID=59473 RepID=A0ABP0A3D0_PIPNA
MSSLSFMLLGQKRPNIASETLRKSACKAMKLSDHMTLSYSLMKVKRTENIFHYDFLFLIFLFMLRNFKILVFECSQSPREKLTKLLFIAKAFLLQQKFYHQN